MNIREYSAKKFIFSMVSEKVSPYFSLQFSLFLEENFEDLHFELWIDCQEFPGHIEKNLLFLESNYQTWPFFWLKFPQNISPPLLVFSKLFTYAQILTLNVARYIGLVLSILKIALVCKSHGIGKSFIKSIYECSVKITPDINPY